MSNKRYIITTLNGLYPHGFMEVVKKTSKNYLVRYVANQQTGGRHLSHIHLIGVVDADGVYRLNKEYVLVGPEHATPDLYERLMAAAIPLMAARKELVERQEQALQQLRDDHFNELEAIGREHRRLLASALLGGPLQPHELVGSHITNRNPLAAEDAAGDNTQG